MSRRAEGFTLLEILVAVAVLGLLLVMLEQGVAFGLRAAATRARAETSGNTEMSTVDSALRGLIAAAGPGIFPEPGSLSGTAESLSLVTTRRGADGARQRIDAVLFARDGQLRLRWTPHRHIARFGPPPSPQESVLLDGIGAFRIGYAAPGGGEWQSRWTGEKLPALIRLQITFESAARHWPPIIAAPKLEALGQ